MKGPNGQKKNKKQKTKKKKTTTKNKKTKNKKTQQQTNELIIQFNQNIACSRFFVTKTGLNPQ